MWEAFAAPGPFESSSEIELNSGDDITQEVED